jgi:hypothetical protein
MVAQSASALWGGKGPHPRRTHGPVPADDPSHPLPRMTPLCPPQELLCQHMFTPGEGAIGALGDPEVVGPAHDER